MIDGLLILWGIILVASIVVLLDWFSRRRERQSKQRPSV